MSNTTDTSRHLQAPLQVLEPHLCRLKLHTGDLLLYFRQSRSVYRDGGRSNVCCTCLANACLT